MKFITYVFLAILCSQVGSCQKIALNTSIILPPARDTLIPPDTLNYYILAGQSNMAGRVSSSSYTGNYSGAISAGIHKVYVKKYAGTLTEQMITGTNTSDQANLAGIQPIIGYELSNYKNKDIYVLQSASGGKAIDNWDSTITIGKWLDSSISNEQTRQIALNKRVKFRGFVWIQGESDGGDNTGYYQGKLEALIARVRRKTNTPSLPVVIVQMGDCQTGVVNLSLLQATQATVAAESNNYLISKSVGDTCQDSLHFDYTGILAKALAIFNILKDL